MASSIFKALFRKKYVDFKKVEETNLNRILSTVDLTFLGVGSTLGLGFYILSGQAAATKAGPAVVLSFAIAGVASIFAGLCYAEFGARVPKAGSAYTYSYVTIGEFIAFIIGWNLVLEYVIGTASVARGVSGYIDALFNGAMANSFNSTMHMDVPHLAEYPDFFAFAVTALLTGLMCFGVKESALFNNIFTVVNLLNVAYIIICGLFWIDTKNWNIPKSEVPPNRGEGGFFAYGFSGIMAGAAMCFYGFVGFDVIATTGEEAKNPQKSVPVSIVCSLLIVMVSYCGVSAVQTLIWPYYDQYIPAPIPYIFDHLGWPVAKWIVAICALGGLSASLVGAIFPMPRIIFAMARDGLIFKFLASVNPRTQMPIIATLLSGLLAGGMALLFDIQELTEMMSIGTLLAYSLVAVCVLVIRYRPDESTSTAGTPLEKVDCAFSDGRGFIIPKSSYTLKDILRQLLNSNGLEEPSKLSSEVATVMIIILGLLSILFSSLCFFLYDDLSNGNKTVVASVCIIACLFVFPLVSLSRQPNNPREISFKVPLVPLVPFLSVLFNVYLTMQLQPETWIRFGVWMALGFLIYGFYGFWKSTERRSALFPAETRLLTPTSDDDLIK